MNNRLNINAQLHMEAVTNMITSRMNLLRGVSLDGTRDIDLSCGYPQKIDATMYRQMWAREGVGTRCVSIWPEECWQVNPEIYETETLKKTGTKFEKELDAMNEKVNLFAMLKRVDELSRIGRYGALLIGYNDGKELSEPALTSKTMEVNYLRAFDESLVDIQKYVTDTKNPRYGLPEFYQIRFVSNESSSISSEELTTKQVHWTRVIHVADGRKESEVMGTPEMQNVWNRLVDLRKILGGSAEMFWQGGFPGFAFETNPEIDTEIDKESVAKQMDEYSSGLKRWIGATGVSVKSLQPQVADPSAHIQAQIEYICITKGIPKRVFMGSEQGQLASEQDSKAWNKRVDAKRNGYITPFIINPFINRMIEMKVLTAPAGGKFYVFWPDLNNLTAKERSEVAKNKTESLARYVQGAVDSIVAPKEYLVMVLEFTEEEADAILKARDKSLGIGVPDVDKEMEEFEKEGATDE